MTAVRSVRVGAAAIVGALVLGMLALVAAPANAAPAAKPVAARPSAGCRLSTPATSGDSQESLTAKGVARTYLRHVPPVANPAQPVPLVVDFPGYLETSGIEAQQSQLGAYGDTHGFVTVTPQAPGPVYHWTTTIGSPDVRFVGALLDDVERAVCIDTSRVYVTGLSNGAMMTSAVICAYSDRIAAAAPVAGITLIPKCKPRRVVPVIAFHGTADPFLSYTGGLGPKALALPAPDGSDRTIQSSGAPASAFRGPSVPKIVSAYAHRNGCRPQATTQAVAGDVTEFSYRCPPGAEVELYRIAGGGHSWPGSAFSAAIASTVGPTTFSISATPLIWQFFSRYALPGR
jgi:polyhydroxybutyrate depolymerase